MTLLRQFILYIILIYFSSLLLIHFSILFFKLVCNIDFLFQSITKKKEESIINVNVYNVYVIRETTH